MAVFREELVPLDHLLLDLGNPRMAGNPTTQRDAVARMAAAQGDRILVLAEHIAKHGLSPAERFIAVAAEGSDFVVLDGNRRLAALRMLRSPELVASVLGAGQRRRLERINGTQIPAAATCVVFENAADADTWIELQHGGAAAGAGLVEWTAQQKAKHAERHGAINPYLEVMRLVRDEGRPSPAAIAAIDAGQFKVSTFERALATPEVAEMFGLEFRRGGAVRTRFPRSEIARALAPLVDQIASGELKVGALMNRTQRLEYFNRYDRALLPNPALAAAESVPIRDAPARPSGGRASTTRPRENAASDQRTKLIPRDFVATIGRARINDVYHELKDKLVVDVTPNATGALFRIFLELSVDDFARRHGVKKYSIENDALEGKVAKVANHMEATGLAGPKDLTNIRQAIGPGGGIVTTFNAVVHNPDGQLAGSELKAMWVRLQTFFEKLWTPKIARPSAPLPDDHAEP